jgi:S-adenosylmethionine:tRNA ribosyltransferase-isomerase
MPQQTIEIKNYSYPLPPERIAIFPVENRDDAKLLVIEGETFTEDVYRNIASYLPQKSSLVFNDSRVIEARLLFQKPTGGIIEIFLLEPSEQYHNYANALAQTTTVVWKCMVGGAGKWKHGMSLEKQIDLLNNPLTLTADIIDKQAAHFNIEFKWQSSTITFAEILHHVGSIPLPPYLKRQTEAMDIIRYQTVYASTAGSVAAPTAGLHFTPALLDNLKENNIQLLYLTLHVGAGTFKPVTAETLANHVMHAEWIEVKIEMIQSLLLLDNIFAVGTTALRSLESLYWMGVKTLLQPDISPEDVHIHQWEVYKTLQTYPCTNTEALTALLLWMKKKQLQVLIAKTQLLITPSYTFRIIKGLITNFHQPQSTLLLIIAALCGERWKEIYQYALDHDYRFLSYGDGCLIKIQAN